MKKDTTQPPTEKPVKNPTEQLQQLKEEYGLKEKKEATVIVFDDEYVTISISPVSKKVLKVGDRVKNAIKAMLKEGYTVKIQNLKQPELPF